jgi:hypothetical protein
VNNRDKNFTRAKMERRMAQIEESVARYLRQLDSADRQALARTTKTTRLKADIGLQSRLAAFAEPPQHGIFEMSRLVRAGRSPRRQLKPGTVLVRDYHGQRHTVTVAPDGFDWQCTSARSRHARQIYLK